MNLPLKKQEVHVPEIMTPDEIIRQKAQGLIKTPEGLAKLHLYLEEEFPQERIKNLIKDLCSANDLKMDRSGTRFESPNWAARTNGLDRVLKLLKYSSADDHPGRDIPPTKIVFNVISHSTVQVDGKSA